MRHKEQIELHFFRFDLVANFVYIFQKSEIFLDEGGLGIGLDSLELRLDASGSILTSVKSLVRRNSQPLLIHVKSVGFKNTRLPTK